MEKNINTQQALFFSFLKKTKPIKQKKIIKISYLIMVLIKMGLYNNLSNIKILLDPELHFPMFLALHFHIFKFELQFVVTSQMAGYTMN